MDSKSEQRLARKLQRKLRRQDGSQPANDPIARSAVDQSGQEEGHVTSRPNLRQGMLDWDFAAISPRHRAELAAKLATVPMEVPSREGHLRFLNVNKKGFR